MGAASHLVTTILPFSIPRVEESDTEMYRNILGKTQRAKNKSRRLLADYQDRNFLDNEERDRLNSALKLKVINSSPKQLRRKLKGKSQSKINKFLAMHFKNLFTAKCHLDQIHADELDFDGVVHNTSATDILLTRHSVETTLCAMQVNGWSPKRCKAPKIKSIEFLYNGKKSVAEVARYQRDIVIFEFLEKSLEALENTLNCLLDTKKCFKKVRHGRKRGNRRKGKNRDRKRQKGNKTNKIDKN